MNVFTLAKGRRIAFGHFKSAEITQKELEGWKVESVVYLKRPPKQQQKRRSNHVRKSAGLNKNGIPIMQ